MGGSIKTSALFDKKEVKMGRTLDEN